MASNLSTVSLKPLTPLIMHVSKYLSGRFLLAATCTGLLLSFPGRACDTWVALANSTRDGSVIMGKNSDRKVTEAQPLMYHARHHYQEGEVVKLTKVSLPQATETYEHIGSRPSWTWGYEHGLNEWGVAIGNEAVKSRVPAVSNALIGMDLIRLGLERGKTAYEAMHVMISHLDPKKVANNSFIIADPQTAWVLETAGEYWVAKQVRDVGAISNVFSIERDYDEAHPEVVSHAIAEGWCKSEESFSFARCYTPLERDYSFSQNRYRQVMSILRQHKGDISVELMMDTISRSHHEGTLEEPKWAPNDSWFCTVCMHNGPEHGRTAASMVVQLWKDRPPPLRAVYWASFSSPCVNVFKPFYFAGRTIPENYSNATDTYDPASPWWSAEKLKRLVDLNYNQLAALPSAAFRDIEKWELAKSREIEAKAARLMANNRESEARQLLRDFSLECCNRVEKEYARLLPLLESRSAKVGTDYLWLDALREACKTNGLSLPGL
ncbi:MAG TPA: C69 family dipeptidase [Opitutaceae bacterium]|nr:C69 family dipeptidase [Opitutaceae bacterium]